MTASPGKTLHHPLFARMWTVMSAHETPLLRRLRSENLAGLSGRVLEVGAGTGTNFAHYPESVREVVALAFTSVGLPKFNPHSFRKTLISLAMDLKLTPEAFKAWSQNLGHESVVTTMTSYMPVSLGRQRELIKKR